MQHFVVYTGFAWLQICNYFFDVLFAVSTYYDCLGKKNSPNALKKQSNSRCSFSNWTFQDIKESLHWQPIEIVPSQHWQSTEHRIHWKRKKWSLGQLKKKKKRKNCIRPRSVIFYNACASISFWTANVFFQMLIVIWSVKGRSAQINNVA